MNPCQDAEKQQHPCVPRQLPGPRRATGCHRERQGSPAARDAASPGPQSLPAGTTAANPTPAPRIPTERKAGLRAGGPRAERCDCPSRPLTHLPRSGAADSGERRQRVLRAPRPVPPAFLAALHRHDAFKLRQLLPAPSLRAHGRAREAALPLSARFLWRLPAEQMGRELVGEADLPPRIPPLFPVPPAPPRSSALPRGCSAGVRPGLRLEEGQALNSFSKTTT